MALSRHQNDSSDNRSLGADAPESAPTAPMTPVCIQKQMTLNNALWDLGRQGHPPAATFWA